MSCIHESMGNRPTFIIIFLSMATLAAGFDSHSDGHSISKSSMNLISSDVVNVTGYFRTHIRMDVGYRYDELSQHWVGFAPGNEQAKSKSWKTAATMGDIMSSATHHWLQSCSDGGWASSPSSATPPPPTFKRLAPTRQENLASGYTYFENLYVIDRQFVMIQKHGGAPLEPESWALIDWEKQQKLFGSDTEKRPFGSTVWEEQSWFTVEDCHIRLSDTASDLRLGMLRVPGAVMITDILPKYTPHLYHMVENMLGLWPTYQEYALPRIPCWLVLPQNANREFGPAVKALVEAIFPGMLVIDKDVFMHITQVMALDFEWVVAADRSAADHGGVNQMISGIFNHTLRHMPSFVDRVFGSLGIIVPKPPAARDHSSLLPRVSFVDRRSSSNRRLAHSIASEFLWTLAGNSRVEVRVLLFEQLPLADQLREAALTDVLVGVHGNGLTHSLFISSPGAVVEIIPGAGNRLVAFQQFAELRGNSYFGVDSSEAGVVHREGSCSQPEVPGDDGKVRAGCEIGGKTLNTIIKRADTGRLVCVVYEALFSTGLLGYPLDDVCWSPCTESRPPMSRDSTCKYGAGIDYSCKDLHPYKVHSIESERPHTSCLSGKESWRICQHGHFLCESHLEADGILGSMAEAYLREWSLVEGAGIDVPRAPFARGGADLADPSGCCKRHKLCVVVTFRDSCPALTRSRLGERSGHLLTFKRYMRWFLSSVGHKDYDLVIVNQTDRGLFNRAVLINVGVDIARVRGCDYVSINDVDLMPMNTANDYGWPEVPTHQCTSSNSSSVFYDWENCGPWCIGGAALMQLRHYAEVRGMSNRYNGWGGEDTDLEERIRRVHGAVKRLDPAVGRYLPLAHGRNDETQMHPRTGHRAHDKNVENLERLRQSTELEEMERDGFRQLKEHARLLAVREEGQRVVTALVDVLEDGNLQDRC